MIYETINSRGLCILNNGKATHLGRPICDNSTIDISFSLSNVIWNFSWSFLDHLHLNFISIRPTANNSSNSLTLPPLIFLITLPAVPKNITNSLKCYMIRLKKRYLSDTFQTRQFQSFSSFPFMVGLFVFRSNWKT